jgi:multidrug efflux system membrane fusion protein
MNPEFTRSVEKVPRPSTSSAPMPARRPRILGKLITLIILVAAGYFAWKYRATILSYFSGGSSTADAPAGRRGAAQIPPVVAATVKKGDVHIFYDGLGNVLPLDTVPIKTQVNGQIMNIYFKEGQTVQVNDPLYLIDPRPYEADLQSAQGALDRDKAILANDRIDLTRYKSAAGAVSDQQIATQQATVDEYVGIVATDQAQIDTYKLDLIYCHINSPIAGRIGLTQEYVGNFVQTSDTTPLDVITQLQPITVVFALPEVDLPGVMRQNGGVGLTVDAYDSDDQILLSSGKVLAVDNEVDPTTGTFKIKAIFANADSSLFPSQFVNAHLLVRTIHNANIVPPAAVQTGPNNEMFVYVVNQAEQTVKIRNVQQPNADADVVALTGVQPGEVVVIDGTDKLQDGTKVTVTMAQDNPTTNPATQPSRRGHRRGAGGGATTEAAGGGQ